MRRLRLILTGLGVLLAALVVAGYVALVSIDLESYRGSFEQRAERMTGRALNLSGPMSLDVDFSPAIAVEGVRFANADWGSRSDMAQIARFELEVALLPLLQGEIRVRRLVLVEPRILLETGADGRGNWVMGDGADAGGGAGRMPTLQSVRIENGRITYRDGSTGYEVPVSVKQATLAETADDRLVLEAAGGYRTVPFTLDGTLGRPESLVQGRRFPVDLTLEAAGATATVQGALAQGTDGTGPDLDVTARADSLADLDKLAGTSLPAAGPLDLQVRVRDAEGGGYALNGLKLGLGDSDLSGDGTLHLDGPRPRLTGRFTAATLDLAALTGSGSGDAGAGGGGRLFPDTPLPLAALGLADADLELKVGTLHVTPDLTLREVTATARLQDRLLRLTPLQAGFEGGRVTLDGALDAAERPAHLEATLRAQDIDYGRLLRRIDRARGISGTLSLDADLESRGDSPHALAAGLNGALQVVGGEGRVDDALLDAAGAGLRDVLAPWAQGDDDMNLNCVVGRFALADGVAESRAILADTDDVTLVGDGTIDLGREQYDLVLTPKAKQTSLASLAIPMRVTGPLTDPQVGPDPTGAAKVGAIAIGSLINPLATLGALILDSETADQNPCVEALRKAEAQAQQDGGSGSGEGGVKGFLNDLGNSIDDALGVNR
jgi:hypothetical protein